jgi:hypothetical protein
VSAEVRVRLRGSIESISKAAGIPEEHVNTHIDRLLTKALNGLTDRYVNEMGNAVERVGDLRKIVHGYYVRAFKKQLTAEEMAKLQVALDKLHDTARELVPPDVWAMRQLRRPAGEIVPDQVQEPFVDLGTYGGDARRPGRAEVATVAPRWATSRTLRQRFDALPAPARLALEQAGKFLEQSTVEDALAGKPGSVTAMVNDLRDMVSPAELRQALDAVALVQHPDAAYALGGGLDGSRPPVDPVRAVYDALLPAERAAFDRAAKADPEAVRAAVTAETSSGSTAARDADLQGALTKLNQGHRAARGAVEQGVGTSPDARSRAAQLGEQQITALGLPSEGQVAEQLRGSVMLRDLGSRSPDKLLDLARGWLDKVARDIADRKPPMSMEEYVRVLMDTNERGMVGEFGAVFQLGKLVESGEGVLVLKAPGTDVNVSGTDFIVVLPGTDEIWLCDNKTLSTAGLGEVTSLVERIGSNLSKDVEQLNASLAGLDPALPGAARLRGALRRLAKADTEVRAVLDQLALEKDFSRLSADEINKAIGAEDVQNRIAAILDHPDIRVRRVITNAGGELTYLQKRLTDRKIDLADLRQRSAELLDAIAKARRDTPPQGGTP